MTKVWQGVWDIVGGVGLIRRSLGVGRRRSRVGDKGKYWNGVWTTGNDSVGVGPECEVRRGIRELWRVTKAVEVMCEGHVRAISCCARCKGCARTVNESANEVGTRKASAYTAKLLNCKNNQFTNLEAIWVLSAVLKYARRIGCEDSKNVAAEFMGSKLWASLVHPSSYLLQFGNKGIGDKVKIKVMSKENTNHNKTNAKDARGDKELQRGMRVLWIVMKVIEVMCEGYVQRICENHK
ncbi:hypothetical protein BYT27DRAFT_7208153 [Phlegmacium glaucopus]|nr:hypothetical protein BYT27DRAFT_7208153 [Phlegmacium glaucopus]